MEALHCPQPPRAIPRRSRRSVGKVALSTVKTELPSSRSVILQRTATASRPCQTACSTTGGGGNPLGEFDSEWEQGKGREADNAEGREERDSSGEQEQVWPRNGEDLQKGETSRPQGGNGIAPGLVPASSAPPLIGKLPLEELGSISQKQDVFSSTPGVGSGKPSKIPLGLPSLPASSPKARPSSVFSDVSDDEDGSRSKLGSNGSWIGQPARIGPDSPWNPGGVPFPTPGRGSSKAGASKGINLGMRGRQSVLGNATMQGSRFEVGAGDTSWINSMSPDWFPVIPLWQATEKAAIASEPFLSHMSQGWRVLLLSDGSVTRHLHLLTGHRVSVECLEMRPIGHSLLGVPPGTALVAGPRVQRQVLLKTKDGTPLAYAASWWAEYEAKLHLQETHTAIWTQLHGQRMELFRSLECLYYGHTRELEKLFGRDGPFWARHYLFYHNGRPLTLIYEVFSPALDEWLGDSSLPEDLYLP